MWQLLWMNRPIPKDGFIELGHEPGFGIRLEPKLVEKFRIA
jgi:L-alanine-DL-glutamate epimerase-like enolase superfamily enzyme